MAREYDIERLDACKETYGDTAILKDTYGGVTCIFNDKAYYNVFDCDYKHYLFVEHCTANPIVTTTDEVN